MSGPEPSELDDALAPTAARESTQAEAPRGLEVQHLEARTRELLFGAPSDPVRIGRFAVLRRIGEGGMGVVYSAYDDELERKVAIKLVRPELGLDDAQIRIRREAQAAARLSHPNVVAVYEIGEHQGRLFVAMEFVRGKTLRQWLRAAPRSWQSIVDVFVEAGHGLQAAHAAGLVHRDFKPDNVMIGDPHGAPESHGARAHGRVRVLDFGVARRVIAAPELGTVDDVAAHAGISVTRGVADLMLEPTEPGPPTALTGAGALIGTPAYMAPEQLAGLVADARSDQFAFCLSMWIALFDASPFADDGDDPRRRSALRAAEPPRPPSTPTSVPVRVRRLLERGLSPRPEDRHPSMDGLIAGLAAARHRPRRWGIALALTAVASAGVGIWATYEGSDCDGATEQLAQVWSRSERDRIHAELRGPDAAEAWRELEPALDAEVADWRLAHGAACDGILGVSEDVALQQRRCLAARATELRGVVTSLTEADAAAVRAALATVQTWDAPAACLDSEHLRLWAEREALMNSPPPPGSAAGLVSDFDSEPIAKYGLGWVKSTDELIDGESEAAITIADVGAHGSAHSLGILGHVRHRDGPMWAGAMFFPGPQAMAAANLATLPLLSFAARGTPGRYEVVLFTQSQTWGDSNVDFEVDEQWRDVQIDLRDFGVPLYDVTGIFVGRAELGPFECFVDDVRLDGDGSP